MSGAGDKRGFGLEVVREDLVGLYPFLKCRRMSAGRERKCGRRDDSPASSLFRQLCPMTSTNSCTVVSSCSSELASSTSLKATAMPPIFQMATSSDLGFATHASDS